jgi:hypothetical protein
MDHHFRVESVDHGKETCYCGGSFSFYQNNFEILSDSNLIEGKFDPNVIEGKLDYIGKV